jgi:hypothetical protein
MVLSLLGLGACSGRQPRESEVPTCEPIVEVHEKLVPLPQDLTATHPNPAVPNHGDNSVLLEWAMACAANTRLYENQMKAIRDLER